MIANHYRNNMTSIIVASSSHFLADSDLVASDDDESPTSAPTLLVCGSSEFRNVTALPAPPLMPVMSTSPSTTARKLAPVRRMFAVVPRPSHFSQPSNPPPMAA
jgi:hypothetical protein